MANYRKKPVVIQATQWQPGMVVAGVRPGTVDDVGEMHGLIKTLEGTMVVSPGDYVITGVKGEIYPCKPDIFEATYELVADE